jgi:hypothetical protein
MNPATARAALAGVVTSTATLAGLTPPALYWAHRPQGMTSAAYVLMQLRSLGPVGRDAVVYDYDATAPLGAEITPRQIGHRVLRWSVRCVSHRATDAADALAYAMALRDRLHLDEIAEALAAVNLAVADVLSFTELEMVEDRRELSIVAVDIGLNATAEAAGTPLGYVEHWGIEGEAELADGTTETFMSGVYP